MISDLDTSTPKVADMGQYDEEIRGIKLALQDTLPGLTAPVGWSVVPLTGSDSEVRKLTIDIPDGTEFLMYSYQDAGAGQAVTMPDLTALTLESATGEKEVHQCIRVGTEIQFQYKERDELSRIRTSSGIITDEQVWPLAQYQICRVDVPGESYPGINIDTPPSGPCWLTFVEKGELRGFKLGTGTDVLAQSTEWYNHPSTGNPMFRIVRGKNKFDAFYDGVKLYLGSSYY